MRRLSAVPPSMPAYGHPLGLVVAGDWPPPAPSLWDGARTADSVRVPLCVARRVRRPFVCVVVLCATLWRSSTPLFARSTCILRADIEAGSKMKEAFGVSGPTRHHRDAVHFVGASLYRSHRSLVMEFPQCIIAAHCHFTVPSLSVQGTFRSRSPAVHDGARHSTIFHFIKSGSTQAVMEPSRL